MPEWLRHLIARVVAAGKAGGLWWGLAISVALALGSLAIAALVVVSWDPERFKPDAREAFLEARHPVVRALARVGKNLAGVVLVLLGIVMALPGVPGQGILTMIIGLTLLDFPGKRAFERRLVSRPFILRQLNALRARFRRPALELG
ncbi:MAG TPA: hypothetical protein VH560_14055 [Polyangia bacterium]|nr:hypothetical protein [Polyangia bacterium]